MLLPFSDASLLNRCPGGAGRRSMHALQVRGGAATPVILATAVAGLSVAGLGWVWSGADATPVSKQALALSVGGLLSVALALAVYGLLRQRRLRREIAAQAARLAESEARLAEAQRIAHVGHWRYDAATGDLSCSEEALRILGRKPARGRITLLLLLRGLLPSDRKLAHRALRDALDRGVARELTLSLNPRPGVRRIVHLHLSCERDPIGKVRGLFGTVQDVTQRTLVEEDLRAREHLLSAIYENVPSALGVVEPAGTDFRFVSANPGTAKLLGVDPGSPLAGRLLSQLGLPDDAAEVWAAAFRRGVVHAGIYKMEPTVGRGRQCLSFVLIPLGSAVTAQPQLCFLVEDVTERKQMDAEVAQGRKLRAIGELVGGIAHEFNNLLTPILLKTELIGTELHHEPRVHEDLKTIARAAQRGADLTKRLLAFGRRSEPKSEVVNLPALLRANLDLLRPTLDRRIHLVNTVPESLPSLFLDPSDLHQIILNLLLNARDTLVEKLNLSPSDQWRAEICLEATEYGPRAGVLLARDASEAPFGWIRLSLRDNGMGIPPDVIERIFEPFYTTKGVGKGTGLGLATAWHLTNRLGGKLTVHSNLGEGTEFRLWLPLLTARAGRAVPPPRALQPHPAARLCLVEDDDLVARSLLAMLRRSQHEVAHFRHGAEAWRHLSDHAAEFDLILLDLDLPGLNGREIARRLRQAAYAGKIAVMSGHLSEEEARHLEKIGVDAQLEKPFASDRLMAVLASCLAAQVLPASRS